TPPETKSAKTDKVIEDRLNNIETLIEEKLTKPEEPAKKEETSDKDKKDEKDELKVFFDLLLKTMLDNEVEREYASSIIDETARVTKPGTPFDVALAGIYQKMILKFGKASVISPAENGPKTVFFVGPTGVGKTTTIAKIASKFSVELKKKVALLTADTYRIAAAEQLRTYANILEVPFRIIYTIEEMESALKDFKNFDYVFVDTAGHSHQNEEQKNVMGSFIHSVDGIVEREVYLVVSATTKYRDLMSIADAYSTITDYKLIFTKLDETTALGNLLNLKLYTGADLSYITCGQNVPDDIEDFNAQSTVKNLLGGKK
ncbi:MAG: AAA family ATPase, partial [Lachnospiraceae bacterium]|nr:AAA family ATPase [Lachnospiraceae bacterium]